jgi:hypothetical protein
LQHLSANGIGIPDTVVNWKAGDISRIRRSLARNRTRGLARDELVA